MGNIPTSFMGYNKQIVDDILTKKDFELNTQQKDINYLRNEISRLEKNTNTSSKKQ